MHIENLKEKDNQSIHMLLARLERISADSYWAHRASGIRGALLRVVENSRQIESQELKDLLMAGFEILEKAGREMHGHDRAI